MLHDATDDHIGAIADAVHINFNRQIKNYASSEALLLGFETRTSSPLRIPRDPATLQHPEVLGFFPCGEGAGYAGGIVSAALDGLRCADATVEV